VRDIEMHDGSHLRIRKLSRDYDPTDRMAALTLLEEASKKHEVLTGVLYLDTTKPTFVDQLNMTDEQVATLPQSKVRPSRAALEEAMEELR
jgi:2-oxoglutarate ferredoxin oxidoreductase subunit beta